MGRNENPVLSAVDDAQTALSDFRPALRVIAAHRPAGEVQDNFHACPVADVEMQRIFVTQDHEEHAAECNALMADPTVRVSLHAVGDAVVEDQENV